MYKRFMSLALMINLLATILVFCGCSAQKHEVAEYPKSETTSERWEIFDVRASNLLTVESSGNRGGNMAAGAVVGTGLAYMTGAAPLGLLAGAAAGAGSGYTIPINQVSLSMSTCVIFARNAQGETQSFSYNSKDDRKECGRCLVSRVGDVITVDVYRYWLKAGDTPSVQYGEMTIEPGPLMKKQPEATAR